MKNSIIQTQCTIKDATLNDAMIGNHVHYNGSFTHVSIGDYSSLLRLGSSKAIMRKEMKVPKVGVMSIAVTAVIRGMCNVLAIVIC